MQHFIWVFTVCQSSQLGVSSPQRFKALIFLLQYQVSIGNVHRNLGYLQYRVIEEKLDTKWSIIIGAIAACVVVIVVIGALVVFSVIGG